MITVVATGASLTVQDLGRAGHAAWGVGSGGASDRASLRLANRLVGNHEGAAAFEVLLGGAVFSFERAALVAVTGAATPVTINGRPGRCDGPQWVPAGAVLALSAPGRQMRSYLAVRGGLDTPKILGSRSVDERSGLGRALRRGDVLLVGEETVGLPTVGLAPRPAWPAGPVALHAIIGPHDDWFTDNSLRRLGDEHWVVAADSDRVGVRLSGPALQRQVAGELLSEPTLRGAVEVPPDGLPIVFGADHPTTCGYPVVAVLESASSDLVAQCRPGQGITFVLTRPQIRLTTISGASP
ncbi:MAG: biotin-dependent carboxyltransferase family protein [Jatrophihabitans sp.]